MILRGFQTPFGEQEETVRGKIVQESFKCMKGEKDRNGLRKYLIVGVVHQRGFPLALVLRVVDHGTLPLTTSGCCLTGGIRNLRGFPFSIHLLIPTHRKGLSC